MSSLEPNSRDSRSETDAQQPLQQTQKKLADSIVERRGFDRTMWLWIVVVSIGLIQTVLILSLLVATLSNSAAWLPFVISVVSTSCSCAGVLAAMWPVTEVRKRITAVLMGIAVMSATVLWILVMMSTLHCLHGNTAQCLSVHWSVDAFILNTSLIAVAAILTAVVIVYKLLTPAAAASSAKKRSPTTEGAPSRSMQFISMMIALFTWLLSGLPIFLVTGWVLAVEIIMFVMSAGFVSLLVYGTFVPARPAFFTKAIGIAAWTILCTLLAALVGRILFEYLCSVTRITHVCMHSNVVVSAVFMASNIMLFLAFGFAFKSFRGVEAQRQRDGEGKKDQ